MLRRRFGTSWPTAAEYWMGRRDTPCSSTCEELPGAGGTGILTKQAFEEPHKVHGRADASVAGGHDASKDPVSDSLIAFELPEYTSNKHVEKRSSVSQNALGPASSTAACTDD